MSVSRIDTRVGKGSERFPGRSGGPTGKSGIQTRRHPRGRRNNELPVPSGQRPPGRSRGGARDRWHRRKRSGEASGCRYPAEAHNQAPPGLALLLPGRSLLDRHAFARQQVRRGEVVPHRVTGEIDRVQRVPPDVPAQARASEERRSRVRARADDRAIVAFDPHLPALEDSAVPVTRERIQDRPGLLDMHRDAVVREAVARHPGSKQQPSRAYPPMNRFRGAPSLQPAVGVQHPIQQGAHRRLSRREPREYRYMRNRHPYRGEAGR